MKKTLIALAAVAAATSAMAQVTIGGTYTIRLSDTKAVGTEPSVSLADSNLNITATEDLGNGLKATLFAESEFGGRLTSSEADAAHSAVGRDVKLTLSGAFGSLTLGDYEAGQTQHMGYVDAPVAWADDDNVISAGTNVAGFGYTAPKFGDFTFSVSGTSKDATVDAMTYTFAVAYKTGALSAKADWNEASKRVRVGATYDLGVAKLGFGAQTNQTKDATKNSDDDQMVLGVSVPMGALTLGGAFSENRDTGGSATEFGASYALSKRTSLTANMRDYNTKATGKDGWRVQISHSF